MLGQLAITGRQLLRDGFELGGIVDLTAIDLVKERDMKVGADQQTQTDLAQIGALLLVVAAGRQLSGVARVDVRKEIGAIVDQGAQGELKALDESLGQALFNGLDLLL